MGVSHFEDGQFGGCWIIPNKSIELFLSPQFRDSKHPSKIVLHFDYFHIKWKLCPQNGLIIQFHIWNVPLQIPTSLQYSHGFYGAGLMKEGSSCRIALVDRVRRISIIFCPDINLNYSTFSIHCIKRAERKTFRPIFSCITPFIQWLGNLHMRWITERKSWWFLIVNCSGKGISLILFSSAFDPKIEFYIFFLELLLSCKFNFYLDLCLEEILFKQTR